MSENLGICFVNFNFLPIIGGAETQCARQARQLQALGHNVTVLTLRTYKQWKRREVLDGLPVVRVGRIFRRNGELRAGRIGYLPYSIDAFLTLWRMQHHYDVIHVFQVSPLAVVAALIGKVTHKPVIISIQSTGPNKMQKMQIEQNAMLMADTLTETDFLRIDPARNWQLGGSDITLLTQQALGGSILFNFLRGSDAYFHVNNSRCYSRLRSDGFCPDRIVRIPHGVDIEKFRPAPERHPDPTKAQRDIICVARLAYAKGVDVLLHAWGRLMNAPANWRAHLKPRLLLVGDGDFRTQLERIVLALGIQDSVKFLGLQTDVINLMQQSWGFVIPSRWESLPNALLEAMACGLPCVATRVSGSEEVIQHGINGLLVEPEQPFEMAQALRRIIADTELVQQMSLEARARVVREYQLLSIVKRFQYLYQCVIETERSDLPFTLAEGKKDE